MRSSEPYRSRQLAAFAKLTLAAATAAAGLSLSLQAQALQLLTTSDGVAVEGIISIKEPTRIRIEGAAITDVFGNIHSSHCAASPAPLMGPGAAPTGASLSGSLAPGAPGISGSSTSNPDGEVVVECDRDKGEIYIRPVGAGDKPVNLFVSSATATYTLVLRRADVPADTIVIRDKALRSSRPGAAISSLQGASFGSAPSHVRAMKALLVAMASKAVPPDIRVIEDPRPLQLWAQTRFLLLRLYEGRGLVGELYSLQNLSDAPLVLSEQFFDRSDEATGTEMTGVAIDRHHLRPGESTQVYVIRRGAPR